MAAAGPLDQGIDDDWESEMIRRGARKTKADVANGGGALSSSLSRLGMGAGGAGSSLGPGMGPFKTVESVLKDLRSTQARVEEAHERNERAAEKARSELVGVKEGLGKLQHEFDDTAARFQYFQDMREYLSSLCGCLREKQGMVAELEATMAQVRRDRAEKRCTRRIQDQDDALEEVQEGVPAPLPSLQGYVPAVRKPGQDDDAGPELDEAADKARRRTERRQRRDKALRKVGAATDTDTAEAEATLSGAEDSDTEGEVAALREAKLREAAGVIFEDVAEEFGSLEPVVRRFEQWKRTYPKEYRTAYVSASLVQVLEPFVRLEMVSWDPLSTSPQDGGDAAVEAFSWFERLFRYSQSDDGEPAPPVDGEDEDPDDRLVPQLVEKVAVGRLQKLLADCYDPMSGTETHRAVAAIQALIIYEPGKHALEAMLQAPLRRLERAVAQTCLPLLPTGAPALAVAFQRRQLFAAVKLFRNANAWHEVLAPHALAPLVLGRLLEKKLAPALENRVDTQGGEQAHATVVEVLGTLEALATAAAPTLLLDKSAGPLTALHRLLDKVGQGVGVGGAPLASTVHRLRLAFGGSSSSSSGGGSGGRGKK